MFSFHKPKIYRSNLGCCICKAKSSSSRFTDSKKYENEFERCFRIQEKRSGEICNACVLLVKRWKKLSPENRLTKHWHHVVDARAGPGTKLSGNRRLTVQHGAAGGSSSSLDPSDRSSSASLSSNLDGSSMQMPLSSNQTNNTNSSSNGQSSRRSNSFSNKARAIDKNESTFTFGEPPYRRSYMTPETFSSSSSFNKPQSALNSSAFESVIKRFRQRQQQQQLEAQRRQMSRQSRQATRRAAFAGDETTPSVLSSEATETCNKPAAELRDESKTRQQVPVHPASHGKRFKRNSESNIGSLTVDGLRVSSFLENSIWRKERVCCGVIFRGLYNEVAIFPKLLKPCQGRLKGVKCWASGDVAATSDNMQLEDEEEDEDEMIIDPPPPRATKSGSISSCDSNTSGTGSMEQPLSSESFISSSSSSGIGSVQRAAASSASICPQNPSRQRRKSNNSKPMKADLEQAEREITSKRPNRQVRTVAPQTDPTKLKNPSQPTRQRRNMASQKPTTDSDSIISSSDSSTSAGFQSASSPSQALLMDEDEAEIVDDDELDGDEEEDDDGMENDDDTGLVMVEDDATSNDTSSSSIESLPEVERKKSTVGALG